MIEFPFDGVIATADAMHDLGVELGAGLRAGDLLVLTGPLGAGKTTLTRGIGEGLGVRGPVTSPTFVLARTHPSLVDGPPLVHVDAYRLSSPLELDDLDIDFAGSVVIVEWGRGMLDGIASTWLDVEIERPTGGDLHSSIGISADASDDVEEIDEPRRVRITRLESSATA
jgi:tRNA threonylcarbamoyl adenosine modification protein YjeE